MAENEEILNYLRDAVKFGPLTAPAYWTGRAAMGIADYAKNNPQWMAGGRGWSPAPLVPQPRPESAAPVAAPTKTEPGPAMPAMRAAAPAPEPMAQAGPPATGFIDQGPPVPEEQKPHIRFAWGGNKPVDYRPGQTDLLALPGAPAARTGFMQSGWVPEGNGPGASYTEGPGGSMRQTWNPASAPVQPGVAPIAGGGGFSPSARWEDLGPQKIEDPAYQQSLAARAADLQAQQREDEAAARATEARMAAQDPLWREKGLIQAQVEGQRSLLGQESELMRAAQAQTIDRWVASAKSAAIAELQKRPDYLAADPQQRAAMEQEALSGAEAGVYQTLAENRGLGGNRLSASGSGVRLR